MGNAASAKRQHHQEQLGTTGTDAGAAGDHDHVQGFLAEAKAEFEEKWSFPVRTTTRLGDYDRIKTLGTGSYGRVMLVRHKETGSMRAMKILEKKKVVRLKQVEHTLNEKKVLSCVSFPFLVNLDTFFKDNSNLYLVLEFVQGGEMFTHLRKCRRFHEPQSRFYSAQVLLAFEYLHSLNVVYRDLKPENLLIDNQGYVKITDFGFAKRVTGSTGRLYTLCGTPEYLAPEIIQQRGYSKAVDWWAFGILLYEFSAGYAPFRADDQMEIYKQIFAEAYKCPSHFTHDLKDLIKNILKTDLTRRYGNLKNGVGDIKHHRWFAGTDWLALYEKKLPAPLIPHVKNADDTSQFEDYPEGALAGAEQDEYTDIFADF
ncbi:cAMP-dependent protein kinase catalytic subunit alpha [Hypsibius exemplaris]|uniref:cAMP-dependent protein kinase catalytic subunit alpha n=1 Tax=Hypsibius exemplaris TaxID=2072580 RepID=A0A1W0XFB5_HYPEX|nr:cAMP-dependent protein kinase catalytic subunit alpha [Hypsibius exemplaris]